MIEPYIISPLTFMLRGRRVTVGIIISPQYMVCS